MYWLMKSEPVAFSIGDLERKPQRTDAWDGVRNYQARNFMKAMQQGDLAFFYHSNCPTPGIVGTMKVARTAHPDSTAFDPKSRYFDPKSTLENPRWYCVDVQWLSTFRETIALQTLRRTPGLQSMQVLRQGSRLSVTPVTAKEWEIICRLAAV